MKCVICQLEHEDETDFCAHPNIRHGMMCKKCFQLMPKPPNSSLISLNPTSLQRATSAPVTRSKLINYSRLEELQLSKPLIFTRNKTTNANSHPNPKTKQPPNGSNRIFFYRKCPAHKNQRLSKAEIKSCNGCSLVCFAPKSNRNIASQ